MGLRSKVTMANAKTITSNKLTNPILNNCPNGKITNVAKNIILSMIKMSVRISLY